MQKIVLKRNGQSVPYDKNKIVAAINGAHKEVYGKEMSSDISEPLVGEVDRTLQSQYFSRSVPPNVENIQDIVENTILNWGYYDLAKAFITHRYRRSLVRLTKGEAEILEMIQGNNEYWNTENSNKDARLANTQRDYIAGITGGNIAREFIFPKDAVKAHDEGIIHIHDIDFAAERTLTNCCLVNLEDMLQNGTNINGIKIEKPHRLITATTIATQIIAAVSGAQYGGLTITLTHLAPFVRSSYNLAYDKYIKRGLNETQAKDFAEQDLKKEVEDAIQTLNYQINSFCLSRAQTPFVTVCMYLNENPEYTEEVAMLSEELMKQRIKGLKNRKGQYITVAFPKLIYVLDDNNIYEDSPYYYLTKIAAQCTAKRMVPDYISAKVMKEMKIAPNGEGCVYPCMGCRSFLTPTYLNEEGKPEFYGRGNIGVCTINLADVGLSANGDFDKFWELMEERTELCYKVQKVRFDRLIDTPAEVNPILWCDGALSRLEPEEKIGKVLIDKHFTSSLGYAGLYECVLAMTGQTHTSGAGKQFATEVMQFLNDKCNEWKQRDPIDYSVYGTPIESTTYKFAKHLRERFGVVKGITDRDFITNSYHVFVEEPISPFDKIDIESQFQKLSPGGAISYIETDDMQDNIEAVLLLMRYMYDNIIYCEFNSKSDRCELCDYEGEMELKQDEKGKHYFECPNCGNTDFNKMNVARRVCG